MKAATILLCTAVVGLSAAGAQAQNNLEARRITASGEAVVYVTPDQIDVALGIETRGLDIVAVKQKNDETVRKVLAVIKDLGVAGKNIQTDHVSIEPRYGNSEQFLGYAVRNTLVVTLNEAAKVEDLISRALQSGVNYIHGVTFQTTALRKYRDQARELALKAAKEKADAMARVLGQTVGAPLQINEYGGGAPWSYYSSWSGWGYARNQMMAQNAVQNAQGAGAGDSGETIALGKIAVRASVSVVFELR